MSGTHAADRHAQPDGWGCAKQRAPLEPTDTSQASVKEPDDAPPAMVSASSPGIVYDSMIYLYNGCAKSGKSVELNTQILKIIIKNY